MYVLIVLIWGGSNAPMTTFQEFNNQAACETAKQGIEEYVHPYRSYVKCVPKGAL